MSLRAPRAAPHRINRNVVLAAGLEAFSAKGFNGASMRDIASAASTSLSNLYNYFPSKSYLLAQLLLDTGSDLYARLDKALTQAQPDPSSQLAALVAAYVDFIVERPQASIIGISEIRYLEGDQREDVTGVRDATEDLFGDVIRRGCASGAFATPYPKEAARAVVSLCAALSGWYRPEGALGRDDIVARYVEFSHGIVGGC
jgi:AcrR family transcriptional regulator